MSLSKIRRDELIALRNRLNRLGDYFYLSGYGTLYVRRDQFSDVWNRKRIRARNRLNARLHA